MGKKADLHELLHVLVERGGSDLHIKVGEPPVIRIDGNLYRLSEYDVLTDEDTKRLMYSMLSEERKKIFERDLELDLAYMIPGLARFRVNVFKQKGHVGGAIRQIPINIQTIDDLGLPQILKQIAMRPRGFVLVTGPTGSGKSTTLAAMIDYINERRMAHIITIEDPIEFVHFDKKCCINQRELGQDTKSFAEALKHVLRQNPDVILVGEMRDLETIALAITAAETGHLVFATLHTTDAAQTIDRIIDVFPPEQQAQIRAQLSAVIEAIICQTLLPRKGGKGRIAAFEIMIGTPAIKTMIRKGTTHQVPSLIETGAEEGMISLDQYLLDLLAKGLVEYEDALAKAASPKDFQQRAAQVLAKGQAAAASAAASDAVAAAARRSPAQTTGSSGA